jgi:hypothetical protein
MYNNIQLLRKNKHTENIMPRTYANHELSTKSPEGSAGEWVSSAFNDDDLNVLTADAFEPAELYERSLAEGRSVMDQAAAEHLHDPGVAQKNRFLGILAELVDDDSSQVSDLLGMLDKQATSSERPAEARQRQFMGLWDLLARVSQDEDLVTWLKNKK